MCAAEVLAAGLGDSIEGAHVIDLAAAPGGKTTRLTELVGPDGLVVANEVERKRLAILHENLDRWGAANVATTSRPVAVLADLAPGEFDAALLDAPCSGEGMFRRHLEHHRRSLPGKGRSGDELPDAIRDWSPAAVRGAARRQAGLLTDAARLVRPGGVLVYSTCTFNTEENEDRIAAFLSEHPDWSAEDARISPLFAGGRIDGTARLWPHRLTGEGHFVALLRLSPSAAPPSAAFDPTGNVHRKAPKSGDRRGRNGRSGTDDASAWEEFRAQFAPGYANRDISMRGDYVSDFFRTAKSPAADVFVRSGTPLGRIRPGRFEPSQALAGQLSAEDVTMAIDWPEDEPRWRVYLRGEEIEDPGPDGWVLMCTGGWGLGWARRRGGVLKNFLPPALRSRR